ncbi:C6 transcription factor [Cordyceps militaris CM01]|uniref:C6 transcription factor n=1 Tax=Cordyceps militaris (strain CM01) TaxID=983644 RepID=G3JL11_CORMM|nr:C6 transcription factor [Cordyceps militaris CM01]EGX90385.1 C6 transcription factor [Cordyceps militaris CM01]
MKRKAVDDRTGSSSSSSSSDRWSLTPSSSSPAASSSNRSSAAAVASASSSASSKPAVSRRGHSKSRLGCLNCKRRRVKCNELRPTCSPCRRLGLLCDYATSAPPPHDAVATAPPATPSSALNLDDLRFYYQFLHTAFPSLPLRAEHVWKTCAALSHQSECLAHAALGLGALHLTKHGNTDYSSQALAHRVAALKIVHDQFAKPPRDQDNADCLFAALLCLAAQTTLLPDGIAEYLTITRAGALVWAFVVPLHGASVFKCFTNESHSANLSQIVSEEEPKDLGLVDEFLASVAGVREICTGARELYYCQRVVGAVDGLRVSSLQAWLAHADLWRAHCYFSNDDFQAFIAPDNYPARLLIAHMLLADYLLGQFCLSSAEEFKFTARREVIVSWVRNAIGALPSEFKPYGEWLLGYCDVVERSDGRYLLTP